MTESSLMLQLACVIKLMTEYPQGLSMLAGATEGPTSEDIFSMVETIRFPDEPATDMAGLPMMIYSGRKSFQADKIIDSEDHFLRIIERVGGWEHINSVVNDWKKMFPLTWKAVVNYARWEPSRVDGVTLDKIADYSLMSRTTFYRLIRNFPRDLARAILNTPTGNEFDLCETDSVRGVI